MIQTVTVEEPKKKGKDIEQEIRELNDILTRLQDVTLVPNAKNILPKYADNKIPYVYTYIHY